VVVVVGGTSSTGGLRFTIQSSAGDYPALTFFAALPGSSLQAITYDVTNGTAATTVVQETPTGGTSWTQASATNAAVGSFSLAFLDAGEAVATDAGTSWPSPQGSLTATLEPLGTLTDAGISLYISFPPNGLMCEAPPGVLSCIPGY